MHRPLRAYEINDAAEMVLGYSATGVEYKHHMDHGSSPDIYYRDDKITIHRASVDHEIEIRIDPDKAIVVYRKNPAFDVEPQVMRDGIWVEYLESLAKSAALRKPMVDELRQRAKESLHVEKYGPINDAYLFTENGKGEGSQKC